MLFFFTYFNGLYVRYNVNGLSFFVLLLEPDTDE